MKSEKYRDVTLIVPAHQAASTLPECLNAILSSGVSAKQIIVVDDGSRDATSSVARDLGVRVIRNEIPLRPARARNIGVEAAQTAIIVFVDSDVVVAENAISRLIAPFSDPTVGAVIGSYDDSPPSESLLSNYRNLLHYFTHQTANSEAETFWSGLGATRRKKYLELGGLDSAWENIEDVEFGLRLRASGDRIILDANAQATHLKNWTLRSMFRTDLWGRAVPWARLIFSGRMPSRILNASRSHRLAALGVALLCLGVPLSLIWTQMLFIAGLGAILFFGASLAFFRVLFRIGGWRLMLAAIPYHVVHYVAALLGYAYARIFPSPGH